MRPGSKDKKYIFYNWKIYKNDLVNSINFNNVREYIYEKSRKYHCGGIRKYDGTICQNSEDYSKIIYNPETDSLMEG